MQFEAFCLSLKSDTDRREHMCNVFNNMEIELHTLINSLIDKNIYFIHE
jgi:hypothetical protein